MRVLVTGGRDYNDRDKMVQELTDLGAACVELDGSYDNPTIVHGKASGADKLADSVAKVLGMEVDPHPADWLGPCRDTCKPGHRSKRRDGQEYCPAAGVYRNQEMLDSGVDLVIAFPGGSGTADMVKRAKAAGVEVYEVKP